MRRTADFVGPPKPRGRKPGQGLGVKTGQRPGSRPWLITNLKPGESLFLEAPKGRLQPFMQQVAADIYRVGLATLVSQSLVLGIEPATREVFELVKLTRKEAN